MESAPPITDQFAGPMMAMMMAALGQGQSPGQGYGHGQGHGQQVNWRNLDLGIASCSSMYDDIEISSVKQMGCYMMSLRDLSAAKRAIVVEDLEYAIKVWKTYVTRRLNKYAEKIDEEERKLTPFEKKKKKQAIRAIRYSDSEHLKNRT